MSAELPGQSDANEMSLDQRMKQARLMMEKHKGNKEMTRAWADIMGGLPKGEQPSSRPRRPEKVAQPLQAALEQNPPGINPRPERRERYADDHSNAGKEGPGPEAAAPRRAHGKGGAPSFGLDPARISFAESPEVEAMGARAVARGNVISFAPGEFAPGTAEGRAVLGHELEHVRGQAAGEVPMTGGVLEEPSFEAAADRAGAAFASGSLTAAGPVDAGALAGHSAPAQMKKKSYVDQIRDIQIPQARARKAGEKWRGYSPENAKGIFEGGTRASANPIMKEAGLAGSHGPLPGSVKRSHQKGRRAQKNGR